MTVPAAATRLTPVSATADARGLAAASTAFVIWGVLPLYLKQLQHVPALQITAHRLVWGCLFGMLLLGVRGELTRVHSAFADPRVRWRLCASAALVSVSWLIYVVGDRQSPRRRIRVSVASSIHGSMSCRSNDLPTGASRVTGDPKG